MKQPLLSVAIPAYNVENFIEETVQSIIKSKYIDSIEILIVNDGSKDSTLQKSQSIAKKHKSVKVIDKKNGGHGSAINSGLANATGKYFRLLDGDDWFDNKEFDKYIEHLKNETADIIFTDYVECFCKTHKNNPVTFYSNLPEYKIVDLDNVIFNQWGPMLPTTTVKTSLLKKFNLKIDEHCFYVDQEYNLACYLCAKTAVYYPCMIYQYRLEREGQSMEKSSLIKNIKSHEKVCGRLLSEYEKYRPNLSKTRQEYLSNRVIVPMCHMQYMIATEWCKSRQHFASFDKILSNYPNFYNNPGIIGKITKFHRRTKGIFLSINPVITKLANFKNSLSQKTDNHGFLITILGCALVIIAANFIVYNYVKTESTIYFWDYSAYWKNALSLIESLQEGGFWNFMQQISDSMATDYNYIPIIPIIPFMLIFGTSRATFLLIILNLFIIPFAIIMLKNTKLILPFKINSWVKPLIFSIFVLSPAVLIPVINGRPDAICLIIIALIIYLLAKTRLQYISNYFTLGFLVFILILMRRYFCVWAICLYISILIVKCYYFYKQYPDKKTVLNKTMKTAIKLFISGCLILLLLMIISKDLLIRYITNNYSDMYSGYMDGDFLNQINLFVRYYGIIFLTLSISGIILIYSKYRRGLGSKILSILLISSILSFLLFSRIQTLGDQHMYMFAPILTIGIAVLIAILSTKKTILKYCAIIPSILILILSIYSFTGTRTTNCSPMCYIAGISQMTKPIVRNDLSEIYHLTTDLKNNMSSTDYVYVLSSSQTFNDDILRNVYLPNKIDLNISGTAHVDKRDGFPYYFFDATYIIIATPTQTHLSDGSQEVISYLSEKISQEQPSNLQNIGTYKLDNGVTLSLYHKNSKYDDNFLLSTRQYFESIYPNYKFLYETIPMHDNS